MRLPAELVALEEDAGVCGPAGLTLRFGLRVLLLLASLVCLPAFAANSLVFCARPPVLSAEQKDHVLVFSQAIKQVLDDSGRDVAIISRSGLDLDRFNIRYSHAGISLKHSQNTRWSVRQLYYACDEAKARIFDQGMSGFLLDQDDSKPSFISLVLLPSDSSARLERAALDNRQALDLLGAQYSANAYAFSTRYQNCNQWVMELLAQAWGQPAVSDSGRSAAQQWLRQQHYQPSDVDVKYRFMLWLSHFVPLVHNDDHPGENLDHKIYQVSMPASVEAFVRQVAPAAERVELCLNKKQIVIHRGWDPISARCEAGAADQVLPL